MTDTPATDPIQNAINWDHPAACKAVILDHDRCLIDWHGRRKLAIVGFASSTRDLAPYTDPEWVIWGLNQLYRHIPRADAWVDIHRDFNDPRKVVEGTDFDAWLKTVPIPVFMCERQAQVPTSVRYPLAEIEAKFGVSYFTSTISYMIAYGIWAGFSTIGIWGVDLIVGKEYDYQKACAEYWLGIATALGIDLKIPDASALLKSAYRYGFEEERKVGVITVEELRARLAKVEAEFETTHKKLLTLDGFRQDLRYLVELATLRAHGGTVPAAEGNTTA